MSLRRAAVALVGLLLSAGPVVAGETLDALRARGHLRCGVAASPPAVNGFDAAFCRAVAAATLGNPDKVVQIALPDAAPLAPLAAGTLDLVARFPAAAQAVEGLRFVTLTLFDGIGVMVAGGAGISTLLQLAGVRACVPQEELADLAAGRRMMPQPYPGLAAAGDAFFAGGCQALLGGRLELAVLRVGDDRAAAEILPETLTKELTGPLVRNGDRQWLEIVRWSVFAMLEAEEQGLNSANAAVERDTSRNPASRRLLGVEADLGAGLGLDAAWAYRIIARVGNYAEVYERHLGAGSALRLERGPNRLWRDGGVLQAMPFQ